MTIIEEIRVVTEKALSDREGFFITEIAEKGSGTLLVEVDNDQCPISLEEVIALTKEIKEAIGEDRLGDYDLTVSSAGLTSPLRLPRQYKKFLDKPLAVLLKKGVKEYGVLRSASDEGIILEVIRKVKVEGKKKKVEEAQQMVLAYDEIKSAVYDLKV